MILDFHQPKKVRPTDKHNKMHQSDASAAGTYVPNMSDKDRAKWKARQIGGQDPRIEIRKTVRGIDPYPRAGHCAAQVLIIVRPDRVIMSTNNRIVWDNQTFAELMQAVEEARKRLKNFFLIKV
jgi:hypothetical protein